MTFDEIIANLDELSLYELRRISNKCYHLSCDEKKINSIKNTLKPGMKVKYFNAKLNKELDAYIQDIRKSRVSIVDCDTGRK